MYKKTKTLLFILLILIFWLPLFQEITHCFKEPELKGAFIKPLKPHISVDSLKSLEFQKKFENYENYNFGFRGFFVKLRNSLAYALFSEVSNLDLILGKNGYMFSWGTVERTMGRAYNGKDQNEQSLIKINFLKNAIEKQGGHLLVLIASSKESIVPDMLPAKFNERQKEQSDYSDFILGLKKYSIPYIDFCSYFKKIVDTCSYPIITKTGFHWSMYGASLAQDSLLKYIQLYLPKPMPFYIRQGVEESKQARMADADFEEPLNLFFSLNQSRYVYPKMEMVKSSLQNKRPKVIIVGDSYFWQIKMLNQLKYIFSDESQFWYYFATSFPIGDLPGIDIKKIAVTKELESADFVVLLGSVGTLGTFPYGVTDYYSEHKH